MRINIKQMVKSIQARKFYGWAFPIGSNKIRWDYDGYIQSGFM